MSSIAFKLYFYQNNHLFKKIAIEKGNFNSWIIGSEKDSHIFINNSRVSKQHLQIVYTKEGLYANDLNSTNGTFFNGIQFNDSRILKHKDKLTLAGLNDCLIVIEVPQKSSIVDTHNNIIDKFKDKSKIFIGRNSDCDVVLNYTTVSKLHASITLRKNKYLIEDLGSRNGTFVNGKQIKSITELSFNDKIFIGRYQLSLEGKTKDLNEELAITAVGIQKTYSNGVKALNKMDLAIPSKSITAIMGPSGCGKSTLLKVLNGDTTPSKGKVFVFNQELFSNWEYLKTQIGYVPQDDIVHKQLTVRQCLFFTAKLRLENLNKNDIEKKIDQVLDDLNILDKKNNLISNLSGGQRKRVSIAVELITDPLILFLDEPTSPLDPQTVDGFLEIMKNLSEKGTTVIMVTHKPEDLDYMDEVIFMSNGGSIVYYGDSKKYKEYFNVKTAVSVFLQISGKNAQAWVEKYMNPRPLSKSSDFSVIKKSSSTSMVKQFFWLTRRYLRIKTNDRMNSLLMIAQAPIIAILICIIFNKVTSIVLFLISISAIWLGMQNAAREIVSEYPIYKRERMYNLNIFSYIFSKISVLSIFSIIQSFIFIFLLTIFYNGNVVPLNKPIILFFWMFLLSVTSTFMGLLLSSSVKTTERAMTILPLILLPQIMLSGVITQVNNLLVEFLSYFTVSRWGVEGFHIIQKNMIQYLSSLNNQVIDTRVDAHNLLLNSYHDSYANQDIFGSLTGTLALDFIIIIIMITFMIVAIFISMKYKDSAKNN